MRVQWQEWDNHSISTYRRPNAILLNTIILIALSYCISHFCTSRAACTFRNLTTCFYCPTVFEMFPRDQCMRVLKGKCVPDINNSTSGANRDSNLRFTRTLQNLFPLLIVALHMLQSLKRIVISLTLSFTLLRAY